MGESRGDGEPKEWHIEVVLGSRSRGPGRSREYRQDIYGSYGIRELYFFSPMHPLFLCSCRLSFE